MTIQGLIEKVDAAYAEPGLIKALSEDEDFISGDGLADFIYYEIQDILSGRDPAIKLRELTPEEVQEVVSGLIRARAELDKVIAALPDPF